MAFRIALQGYQATGVDKELLAHHYQPLVRRHGVEKREKEFIISG